MGFRPHIFAPIPRGWESDLDPRYSVLLSPDENEQVGISGAVARMSIPLKPIFGLSRAVATRFAIPP